jgi:hypothetical protein
MLKCSFVWQVKDNMASQIFGACSATKRHSVQVSLYLLPHVVLQMLLDGTDRDQLEVGTGQRMPLTQFFFFLGGRGEVGVCVCACVLHCCLFFFFVFLFVCSFYHKEVGLL